MKLFPMRKLFRQISWPGRNVLLSSGALDPLEMRRGGAQPCQP